MKKYKLIKDLPDLKSGAIFTKEDTEKEYEYKSTLRGIYYEFDAKMVENSPWFELVESRPDIQLEIKWGRLRTANKNSEYINNLILDELEAYSEIEDAEIKNIIDKYPEPSMIKKQLEYLLEKRQLRRGEN